MIDSKKYTVVRKSTKYVHGIAEYIKNDVRHGKLANKLFNVCRESGASSRDAIRRVVSYYTYAWYLTLKCHHYFVPENLIDFLENANRDEEADSAVVSIMRALNQDSNCKVISTPVCVHFPKGLGLDSSILSSVTISGGSVCMCYADRLAVIGEGCPLSHTKHSAVMDSAFYRAARVFMGLLHYIHAFPETLIPHREEVVAWKKYTGNRYELSVHPRVKQDIECGRSPHYRRGHLRHLMAERYTRMKGKTVWVEGCFVKGKAYDVLSPEQCA